MRRYLGSLIALLMLVAPVAASAQEQSAWADTGFNGLSIRFDQISPTMCAWKFRNDSVHTLAVLNFRIEDFNAESRVHENSTGLIPTALSSGEEFGGGSAFTADAKCRSVRLVVTDIRWQ